MDWRNQPKSYWQQNLSDQQFRVTREGATERAFTGEHWDRKTDGDYLCVCCGSPLFDSSHKFDSGTGWPSFTTVKLNSGEDPIAYRVDRSWWQTRTEVLCKTCDAHLGHVFDDGPAPSGKRYCINSAALKFKENKE